MMSLSKPLPGSIMVNGEEYAVKTDFREWLKLIEKNDYKGVFVSAVPFPTMELMEELQKFISGGEEPGGNDDGRLIDFSIDADYIYSSFRQAYGIDLIADNLHWFEFLALLKSLPEETIMRQIISYRQYDGPDEELKRLKSIWALPHILTEEEKEAGAYFEEVWG